MTDKQKRNQSVKQQTRELYLSLPQEKSERMNRLDVRDKIIELNYSFFGYVASHTFINNSVVDYEDKLQSALLHFCEIWWWYLWQGDETHKGYRQDLSFTVFFKPRIGEMIERELNEVKYSVRRSLCMEVGKQLNKHWGKVTYEDLSDPRLSLPADKLVALKAILGRMYELDMNDHLEYLQAPKEISTTCEDLVTDRYDDIQELLIQEMIRTETKLTDKMLRHMADMYQLDVAVLTTALPAAEAELHTRLVNRIAMQEEYY